MSKQVTIRFVGADPNFTNPKLYVNGRKHRYLYCDEDYTLELTEPENEVYVKVYGYKSNVVILKQTDEIGMLRIEYITEHFDLYAYFPHSSYTILEEVIDMIISIRNLMPGIKKSLKEGILRIECYKRKEYKFKQ